MDINNGNENIYRERIILENLADIAMQNRIDLGKDNAVLAQSRKIDELVVMTMKINKNPPSESE